ncbi:autotransporter outer membrane beta-barrel domain-containing protein [Pasteurellaceae bacterium USgator11]|nr:autotransporter outer membrane beta-barrel domain-containing protein [Pasteurellaceae bacterium USgator41]TNG93951.1 autotransporter outer membrane beta-barrel domain-containing protein [Pasteurellaceae bacterium UScroc12]TNG96092.1 autotransporter outer membrane beta-barrel domain-containing protein [Pasteurellaceae bacterium UScroc31]TNH00767.1 autotransporter outer membrane beta-barrel domain-containing protein [Pasteurellaceae bacterium USgator11]
MQFKLNPLSAIIITCFIHTYASASVVRSDIPYQTYRDFGENKGQFAPGAANLPIYGKNGELIGTLDKAPMIDFSASSKDGVGTLVAPQYSGSVKHNVGYTGLQFGGTGNNPDYLRHTYQMVDRNNHSSLDYHTPRLHKYVTEVAPANILGLDRDAYLDQSRFPVLYRTGSGTQYVRDPEWNVTWLAYPYDYLTGGTVNELYKPSASQEVWATSGLLYNLKNSPLTSYAATGDSGSGLYAWDTQTQQWILVGFQMGSWGEKATATNPVTNWVVYQTAYNQGLYDEDTDPTVDNTQNLVWANNSDGKTSRFSQNDNQSWTLHVKDSTASDSYSGGYNVAMNAGKNITLNGNGGNIVLQTSINQGAGGLTFNNNYRVTPQNNQTWQGAGIIVNAGKTVEWQVNGVENDFLHKLGAGTLRISGKGKNLGSLSAGDGTTVLAQQADEKGDLQAFDKVRLASGRPTVVLQDEKQVNPNNIYFGYRGGRLDINGNNIQFAKIHNVDNGAQIVNHNADKAANVTLSGDTEVTIHSWNGANPTGIVSSIYQNTLRNGTVQYFRLKTPHYWYFPNAASNDYWEYLGTDKDKAIEIYLTAKNKDMYQGMLGETDPNKTNGKLNFTYTAPTKSAVYTLSGGSNLNGEIKVDKGTLLLSGYPTLHAEDVTGDKAGYIWRKDVVIDNDWVTSHFKADSFKATAGATLQLGNYANLEGNIIADSNSNVSLGYSKGDNGWNNSWKCTRSDSSGVVSCSQTALSDALYADLPYANVKGNITLGENANLNFGKTQYEGQIQAAVNSNTHLMRDAIWTMSGNSTLGNLSLDAGSVVKLNGNLQSGNFNTLTVNSNLSGDGRFELNSTFADLKSDRVIVNGLASGNYTLALHDSLKDPTTKVNLLPLLTLNNATQNWANVTATLENGHLDLGAYRYTLQHVDNHFALYNALLPDIIAKEKAEAEAAEKARLEAEAKAAAEAAEKARLEAEAKAAAEAAEKARLEAEAKAAAEAAEKARLEAEAKAAAEAAEKARLEAEAKAAAEIAAQAAADAAEKERLAAKAKAEAQAAAIAAAEAAEKARIEAAAQAEAAAQQNTQHNWISQEANIALSSQAANISQLNKNQTLLNQYVNRLTPDNSGLWSNVDRERMNYHSDNYRHYKQDLYSQQLGVDNTVDFDGGDWLVGLAFGHSNAHNQFAENHSGKTSNHSLSLYNKVILDNQLYLSAVISYNRLKTTLNAFDQDVKQHAWVSSVALGKRWQFGTIGVQPSVDITYYRLGSMDYRINNVAIQQQTLNFWQARSGIMLDKHFGLSPSDGVTLYTALYYTANLNHKAQLQVSNSTLNAALFKNRLESEVGAVFRLGKHFNLTLKGGYAEGDVIESQFNAGLELKYLW